MPGDVAATAVVSRCMSCLRLGPPSEKESLVSVDTQEVTTVAVVLSFLNAVPLNTFY
jgi:hypothetical protein